MNVSRITLANYTNPYKSVSFEKKQKDDANISFQGLFGQIKAKKQAKKEADALWEQEKAEIVKKTHEEEKQFKASAENVRKDAIRLMEEGQTLNDGSLKSQLESIRKPNPDGSFDSLSYYLIHSNTFEYRKGNVPTPYVASGFKWRESVIYKDGKVIEYKNEDSTPSTDEYPLGYKATKYLEEGKHQIRYEERIYDEEGKLVDDKSIIYDRDGESEFYTVNLKGCEYPKDLQQDVSIHIRNGVPDPDTCANNKEGLYIFA